VVVLKKSFPNKTAANMIKKVICITLALITITVLLACNPTTKSEAALPSGRLLLASGDALQSEKQRETSLEMDQADLTALVTGNNSFAFDLYQTLKNTDGNLFYSPYSISEALAMAYAGARGNTEKQIAATLHFDLPQNLLHASFNSLDQELARRGQETEFGDGQSFQLHVVNAIWGQRNYKFLTDFLDVLAVNYGAGLKIVDFEGAPEQSRVTINEWVSGQTEGKINELIPQGIINRLTRLILTNAIYFNSDWQSPFDDKMTYIGVFHLLDGGMVPVLMMRQTKSLGYSEGKYYQAIELPYKDNQLSMVILLPDDGKFNTFEQSLDAQKVAAIMKDIETGNPSSAVDRHQVAVIMPKFKYESDFQLNDALTSMGMTDSFGRNADFSGMTGTREIFIGIVIHKAFVSVDERGTEAAAATVVAMVGAPPGEPIPVTIDRPFIFLIRDIQSGAILFIGRVLNPGA
jgi:serpin B